MTAFRRQACEIISGHPDLNHSITTLLGELVSALPDVEIRRLEWLYPDSKFNIAVEQETLLRGDVIVWQFPFSWYRLPGLMKQWLDEIFVHGFAHGSTAKNACLGTRFKACRST